MKIFLCDAFQITPNSFFNVSVCVFACLCVGQKQHQNMHI